MADPQSQSQSQSGFCPRTKTYHSLRPAVHLPPPSQPLSVAAYTLSLLRSPTTPAAFSLDSTTFLIDAATDRRLTFSTFLRQVASLSAALRSLRRNDVAFIVAPSSLHIPVLYFSLLSVGAVVSPSNPLSTPAELAHQIAVCNPAVAFTTASLAGKLPPDLPVVLLDSPEFLSMLESGDSELRDAAVEQSDTAAILFSSGTTGKVKGVVLTHRNLISLIAGMYQTKIFDSLPNSGGGANGGSGDIPISLFSLPLFHVFGFFMLLRVTAVGETVVLMEKFDFVKMLEAVQKHRVMFMPVSPPLVVALTKSDLVSKYDLSSLQRLGSGGAPLLKEVADRFNAKFPQIELYQGYGLTETSGAATKTVGTEAIKIESVGRLAENLEAKIIDPETGESLPPGKQGELWLRGPTIMKGYVGDDAATAATFGPDGWLKTGDLCYFDSEGYLYIVDRLKELIKYKAYQVPPAELEQILLSLPDIADAAVIPYPDEEAGQIPMGYIVRKPGSNVSAAQIMDSVAKQVAPYKKLRRIAFIDAIPRSAAGKILRRELVAHAVSKPSSKL
ncbi:4-coumarate--CoA ligase-like 9 [Andrographis paniculata]|uniref:4-coumarate--CoA ligase-like 9 n=1 Tax=Andrographis paniculata TaxID=175694 RepID=UPI0021E7C15D|nr:4-coumarate--CoA ligase-like 9 [Andrographis paniculata]